MTRPYVDLWAWFNSFHWEASAKNDHQRLRLWKIFDHAFDLREKNPEQAMAMLREAIALAEQLQEPWMALFYEYWLAEMLIFHLSRHEEGLELATRLVTRCSNEAYLDCPSRARVFITLIAAYCKIDMLSYTDEIGAMIATMESSIPLDDDTHLRLRYYRASLWMELQDNQRAWDDGLQYLEMSTNNDFRLSDAYLLLCHLSYLQQDDRSALDYAYLIEERAFSSERYSVVASSYYWQACLLLPHEPDEARRLFLRGIAQDNLLNLPQNLNLLYGRARYYEAQGEFETSLALWDEQIPQMNPQTPNRQTYFYIFLRRCFVLRQLGRLTEADVEQARQAARRMRKPERYFAQMDVLNDGQTAIPRY
jgi:hypothetical protein